MGKRNATNDAATHRRQARRNRTPSSSTGRRASYTPQRTASHTPQPRPKGSAGQTPQPLIWGCTNHTSRPPAKGDLRKRCHAHSMQHPQCNTRKCTAACEMETDVSLGTKKTRAREKAPRAQDTASARGAIRQRPTLRTVRRRRYAASDISERDASAPDTSEPSAPLSSAPAEGFARLPPKLVTVRSPDASAASSSSFFPPLGLA